MKEDLLIDNQSSNEAEIFSVRTNQGTVKSGTSATSIKNQKEIERIKFIKTDPYSPNIFFRLFYTSGFNIIRYIREGLSTPSDFGTLLDKNKSKNYSMKLINQWNHTRNKNLLRILLRANLCPLILIILGGFIQESLKIISVQIAKSLISQYNEEGNIEKVSGFLFLLMHFILIFFSRKLNDYQTVMGYKIGYQLECLIYSKLMYSKSFKQFITKNKTIITTADIVNYIVIDSYKLINSILTIPTFVVMPFSLIVYFYMIFSYFKKAFFYGLVIFIVFILINFIFLSKFRHHQSLEQKNKDKTMKIIIKTLNDIENIKLNTEEIDYIKKIYQNKDREMACYSNKCLANNINSAILWFVPIAMTIMTIFVFQNLDKEDINVENIFTLLNILIQINGPIRDIPGTFKIIYETWVSVKRIENYLNSSDQNEKITYYEKNNIDLINKRIMIKIDNGYFTWGKQKKESDIKTKNKEEKKDDLIIEEKEEKQKEKKNLIKEEESLIPIDEKSNESEDIKSQQDLSQEKIDTEEKINLYDFIMLELPLEDPETTLTEIVLKNINLTIKKGDLVLIYGKSGSGKSSLLEAILNEMQIFLTKENRDKIITSVNGTISYSSQIPFIYNTTIRQNITLDLSEKKKTQYSRYLKVIDICSLREDISEFNGGDLTEIGENGFNLSSGQKRRIAIARCLYAKKDIYLLDQPTYNLDHYAGLKILVDGISQFLKHKTRIVVTNKEEFAQYANKIIVLKKGEIIFNGNYYELTCNEQVKNEGFNFVYNKNIERENNLSLKHYNSSDLAINSLSKLSLSNSSISRSDTDTIMSSSVEDMISNSNILVCPDLSKKNTFRSLKELTYKISIDENLSRYRYNKNIFRAPIPFLEGYKLIVMACIIILEWQLTINGSDLWMMFWSGKQGTSSTKNWRYLVVYASFGFLGAFCVYYRNRFTTKSTNNFMKNLNFHMAYNLVKAPMNTFYHQTPTSRIINRLSFDMNNLEDNYFRCWVNILSIGTSLVIRMGIYIYFFWVSAFSFTLLAILLILLSLFYIKSAKELNRIECSLRTLLIQFLRETTSGKSTIKAFDIVGDILDEFYNQLDKLYKCRIWLNLSYQWFGLILSLFSFALDVFIVIESMFGHLREKYGVKPENFGLILNYLFTIREELKNFQLSFSDLQSVAIAFERTNEYNNIFSENYKGVNNNNKLEPNDEDKNNNENENDHIFKTGKIRFENYCLKYKLNEKLILNDINFFINSGERIGIIGRTGGGKTTFIYAITRMVEPFAGRIIIDDIDISTLPLQVLRKNISVLSYNHGISEGTLKSNLDPLNKYTEEEIKLALKKLNYWFNENEEENYGLNVHIEESGSNLTLAEKSLISVTKLLLKKNSKIIILDDISSCLDYKTQKNVFEAIYSTFPESTVIILTHEVKDFMQINKIMSIQNGEIVEYGDAQELENDQNSFYNLIKAKTFTKEKDK